MVGVASSIALAASIPSSAFKTSAVLSAEAINHSTRVYASFFLHILHAKNSTITRHL